jgi:3-deoxy-D-manno-octulosonate 8-phosphate phosphatase (KDO 8-P phosphatase)
MSMHYATERAANIQLMIFDVDGVLTDGRLCFSATGEATKFFHALDGQGIKLLTSVGIQTAIITHRTSDIVTARAHELGIPFVYQGAQTKLSALTDLLARTGLSAQESGYMGDDWPDLPVMSRVHFAAAPQNAHVEVRSQAHYVAQTQGGKGAVREVCDFILRAGQYYESLLAAAHQMGAQT